MNLHHLRHLLAINEHRSFRKAADALCLTQPALSRSIQALEEELGVKLIDRVGRRNALTAYGDQVVRSAKRVLFEVAELRRNVSLLQEGEIGTVSVGFGPTAAAILMTPFLAEMASRHPKVQVSVSRGSVDLLLHALRNEAVDIIAVDHRALIPAEDLSVEALPPLQGGFLCRADHPLHGHACVDLSLLRRYPVMSTPLSDEISRKLVMELGPEAHPSHLISISSEDIAGMLDIVEATDALFFGIHECARDRMIAKKIKVIEIQPHVERVGQYALVRLAEHSESPAMALFREFAHARFSE